MTRPVLTEEQRSNLVITCASVAELMNIMAVDGIAVASMPGATDAERAAMGDHALYAFARVFHDIWSALYESGYTDLKPTPPLPPAPLPAAPAESPGPARGQPTDTRIVETATEGFRVAAGEDVAGDPERWDGFAMVKMHPDHYAADVLRRIASALDAWDAATAP